MAGLDQGDLTWGTGGKKLARKKKVVYTYKGPSVMLIGKDGLYHKLESGDVSDGLGYPADWLEKNGFTVKPASTEEGGGT